jgi:CheY-like chemotaxis protein
MLVDDNETDNFISKRIIQYSSFAENVDIFSSGKDALNHLGKIKDSVELLPDLIFLDINMPVLDGFVFLYEFELLSEMIKDKCKVIILSSSDNRRDIERMMANEFVTRFVTKPLTLDTLKEIKELFNE